MTAAEIADHLKAKKAGGGWSARCPAHEDTNASLSIADGENGNVVLHCFAGCKFNAIVDASGIPLREFFRISKGTPRDKRRIVATYDYVDANGTLLFQVCRFVPKNFKQRRPDPTAPGGWRWNMTGVTRVLYHLPEVLAAVKTGQTIYVVEGEKDADALVALGLCATCNVGGAGKWLVQYTDALMGAVVIIIPDRDGPDAKNPEKSFTGQKHAASVLQELTGKTKSVRVVELPDRNGCKVKDAADWIAAGGTAAELEKVILNAPEWTPPATEPNAKKDLSPTGATYYDSARKEYLAKNGRGVWLNLTESQFKKQLAAAGLRTERLKKENISEADGLILSVRDTRDVAYSGPLAGHKSGFYEIGEQRMLVTTSPRIIEPKAGKFFTLDKVLSGLLDEPGLRQRDYFNGWLKTAFEALQGGTPRPGQALAIAGPHDCGKSLLQALITEILGGRYARPYQFMMGLTQFNSDLFEAEHLLMEDESSSTDIRARRYFGAQIKQITVVDAQRCHAKNRTPLSLKPLWRLTITLNDEPENLMVLPPLDDSIEDKIMIFRAHRSPLPMPTQTLEERQTFWNRLMAELPAFLHSLVAWQIPPKLQSQRFGVSHYHHPAILAAVDALAPEARLRSIIDVVTFATRRTPWEGTADRLEKELSANDSEFAYEARRLFSFPTACGVYLARLSKKFPARFQRSRGRDFNSWIIEPPNVSECGRVEGYLLNQEKKENTDTPVSTVCQTPFHPSTSTEQGEI